MVKASLWFFAALLGGVLVGCSTDENAVSPEKMQEFRKQQEEGRAKFNPSTAPPAKTTG